MVTQTHDTMTADIFTGERREKPETKAWQNWRRIESAPEGSKGRVLVWDADREEAWQAWWAAGRRINATHWRPMPGRPR